MSARERVSRSTFSDRVQPVVVPYSLTVLPERVWSAEEWDRIQSGYRSRDMDEKWDVFVEDGVVYLQRSWTGNGIYEARFAPAAESGWRIVQAVVEREPERYRGSDEEYGCVMLELVLSAIVLGEPAQELRERVVELTRRKPGAANAPAGAVQHSALGLRSEA
jgi:hypothetical protein